jgi:hypothetical protein
VQRVLRSERQTLQAFQPSPGIPFHGHERGETPPPKPPKGDCQQGQHDAYRRKFLDKLHSERSSIVAEVGDPHA